MKIDTIDKNFAVKSPLDKTDIVWYDIRRKPFSIYGLYRPETETQYRRLPDTIAAAVSPGVRDLATHTAGGRVRFSTDSPYIALSSDMPNICNMTHMAETGIHGFDLYTSFNGTETFVASFKPPYGMTTGFASYIDVDKSEFGSGILEYTVNFPLYNSVTNVYIGIKDGCTIAEGGKYKDCAPFVYYGSSITQGGCASRPGTCYQSLICRRFRTDYINLGFSGSARGEQEIADYMAGLDMSVFICDYDHNAPDVKHLEDTHYNLYETIRRKKSSVPYIMISRPDVTGRWTETTQRRAVIEESYRKAVAAGDKNVYYINGSTLFAGMHADDCTVDSCHPNDLGFWRMSCVIGDKIAEILNK